MLIFKLKLNFIETMQQAKNKEFPSQVTRGSGPSWTENPQNFLIGKWHVERLGIYEKEIIMAKKSKTVKTTKGNGRVTDILFVAKYLQFYMEPARYSRERSFSLARKDMNFWDQMLFTVLPKVSGALHHCVYQGQNSIQGQKGNQVIVEVWGQKVKQVMLDILDLWDVQDALERMDTQVLERVGELRVNHVAVGLESHVGQIRTISIT
eukprot:g47540.t1